MRLWTKSYWSLYFWYHGKRCSWCDKYTETAYYPGDGVEIQVCDDCVPELCMLCYEKEHTYQDLDKGFCYCTECHDAHSDAIAEMRRDF